MYVDGESRYAELSQEAWDRQVRLTAEAREADENAPPLDQPEYVGWCDGPLLKTNRASRLALYEADALLHDPGLGWTAVGDPFRFGHPLPLGTPVDTHGRCVVCDQLRKANVGKKTLTKGQLAIRAAECWAFVGGPPNPRGGRPRTRKPGNALASRITNEGQAVGPQIGYPVSRGLMARRWDVSPAYMKWATALVTRDSRRANAVRRGTLGLKKAYEDLLIREGAPTKAADRAWYGSVANAMSHESPVAA